MKIKTVFINAIATSGSLRNILKILKVAKKKIFFSIALLSGNGGKAKDLAALNLIIPIKTIERIQECYFFLGHLILEALADLLIKNSR